MYSRRNAKEVRIGNITIGGNNPIAVQSMLNTLASDADACVEQALRLEKAGCEIIRATVPNMEAARGFAQICKESPLPLVADIHFDYKLAIAAAQAGAAKIRINPGNIGSRDRILAVVNTAREIPAGKNTVMSTPSTALAIRPTTAGLSPDMQPLTVRLSLNLS